MKTTTDFNNARSWAPFESFSIAQVGLLLLCLAATDSEAQNYTILHEFGTNESGVWPQGALVQGADATLYGTTQAGGVANQGQVFRIRPDGSGYASLRDFSGSDGASPTGELLLSGTVLYGTTGAGGVSNSGTVFQLNTDGSGFTVLKAFTGSDGASPRAGLCLAAGMLYGTTVSGGVSDNGTVFQLKTDGSGFAVLKAFTGSDGAMPTAGLCVAAGMLYGTTAGFGGISSRGTVFRLNTDGSGFTLLKEFARSDGAYPIGNLVLSGDTLYGRAAWGGMTTQSSGNGVLFKLKTDGNDFAVIRNFTPEEEPASGADSLFDLAGLLVSGTRLYATSPHGGVGALGTLFQLNTDGSGYLVLKQFTAGDGRAPYSGLAQGDDGVLYGTTSGGGTSDCGTVFKVHSDGSGYTLLKQFNGSDGREPEAGLAVDGTTLYGTTCYGGISNAGTLFTINTDGSGYSLLKTFTAYDDGLYPATVPVISGTTLYGGLNNGKIFYINTDGSGYGFLPIETSGGIPRSVLLDGSTIYGTEMEGGPSYYDGMVYKINTDGSGLTVLKTMGGDAGRWPNGPLVLAGKTLYGTAYARGTYYCGTVFKVNTDGTGFSVLKQFTGGSDGGYPEAGLVLRGDTLYGTAARGGSSDSGIVFRIKTSGLDFVVLKNFSGSDGRYPYGNLVLSGTNLCGTTMYGGPLDKGVAFKLSVPAILPVIFAPLASQTAEAASTVSLVVSADGVLPLTYQWFFNSTNNVGVSTNYVLTLLNIQPGQAGTYSVVVTNTFGAVTSSPAMLQVIPPVERRPVPGVKVTGETASLLNVDYADSLSSAPTWAMLGSVSLTSTSQYYFDLTLPLPPQRFYRAWQTGTPGVIPSLDLHMVPAITLTGNIGNSLRLDYINQFGPIDAWVTLDTVTLTNTSQLYFDVSAPGQPQRLYRLTQVP
jgi:uncharacterized repeat protein (TIGR03803 family)